MYIGSPGKTSLRNCLLSGDLNDKRNSQGKEQDSKARVNLFHRMKEARVQ